MALARLWRLRLPLSLLLLAQLLPAGSLASSGGKEPDANKTGRCKPCEEGHYLENDCTCKVCDNGTFSAYPNSEGYCMKCKLNCDTDELLVKNCSSVSNTKCECKPGYFKGGNHPEKCHPCRSCENRTIITECGPTNDRVCGDVMSPEPGRHSEVSQTLSPTPAGAADSFSLDPGTMTPLAEKKTGQDGSAGNWLRDLFIKIGFLSCLGLMALAVLCCFKKKDQLRDCWVRCNSSFRDWTQPQGQVHNVGGSDPRNSFEMRIVPGVTMNGQCNPEEAYSMLSEGNSDSAISVVPEEMPQSIPPETPLRDQFTLEQEPGCTSVASSL